MNKIKILNSLFINVQSGFDVVCCDEWTFEIEYTLLYYATQIIFRTINP